MGRDIRRRAGALALALGMLTTAWASTQTNQPHLHLHDVVEQEPVPGAAGLPALSLTLDFTLLDSAGEVMVEAEPESATLKLIGAQQYVATAQKNEAPWSIVLVVDTSKTLTGFTASAAFKTARFALADSLAQAPQDANLAILTFGTQPATLLDFTRDVDLVQTTLRTKVRALSDQNSCLNDGVYEGVNKLSGASGRRAVLVFSASTEGCGQRPAQDVVDLAQRNHIQIYGVGLRGYSISQGELQTLAGPTGGVVSLREADDLLFGFLNVMSVLGNQWQARATLYPAAGSQTAELEVALQDGTILVSEPVSFEADQNYAQPPEVSVRGQVQSTSTGLAFNLNIVSADLISQLNVAVVSKTTGASVVEQTVTEIGEANSIAVDNLTAGQEYTLVVTAVDSRGQKLSEASADFTYQPAAPVLTILQVEPPTAELPAYSVQLDSLNLENAVKYKAWLVQADQGTVPQPLGDTTQVVPVGDSLRFPVEDLPTGSYQVVVQALDASDVVLAQATSEPFIYQRPSAFEAFVTRIGQTRLAIFATTLICLAVFAVAGVGGGIAVLRRSARPKQVMLVLPERKLSGPAYAPDTSLDRPSRVLEPPPVERRAAEISEPAIQPPPVPRAAEFSEPAIQPPVPREPVSLPPACLSIQEPPEMQRSVAVDRTPFTIGRREGNDLVVRVSNRSGMSGRHATLSYSGGRFYLQDDFSSFGTRVNEEKLQPGIPIPLADGVVIDLGPTVKIKFTQKRCDEAAGDR